MNDVEWHGSAARAVCLLLAVLSCTTEKPKYDYPAYVIARLRVSEQPMGPVLSPDGQYLLLTHWGATCQVYRIRTSDLAILDSVFVDGQPVGAAMLPDGSRTYIACYSRNRVAVLNNSDLSFAALIPVGVHPTRTLVSPDGKYVYVSHVEDSVMVISTESNTVVDTFPVFGKTWGMAFSPDDSFLYVPTGWDSALHVIRRWDNTEAGRVTGLLGPIDVVALPDGQHVYVTCMDGGYVAGIDVRELRVTQEIGIDGHPTGIAALPNGDYLYVSSFDGSATVVIRTSDNEIVRTIPVGGLPDYMAVSAAGDRVYVALKSGDELVVLGN